MSWKTITENRDGIVILPVSEAQLLFGNWKGYISELMGKKIVVIDEIAARNPDNSCPPCECPEIDLSGFFKAVSESNQSQTIAPSKLPVKRWSILSSYATGYGILGLKLGLGVNMGPFTVGAKTDILLQPEIVFNYSF